MDFREMFPHDERRVYRPLFMDLLLLLLEAGVALALLLGIVWWTWPRKRNDPGTRTRDRE